MIFNRWSSKFSYGILFWSTLVTLLLLIIWSYKSTSRYKNYKYGSAYYHDGSSVISYNLLSQRKTPWIWKCNAINGEAKCIKYLSNNTHGEMSFATCKLTCPPFGALWPKPQSVNLAKNVHYFLPSNIQFNEKCLSTTCVLLSKAIAIFKDNLQKYHPYYSRDISWGNQFFHEVFLHHLFVKIIITSDNDYLTSKTDESYNLNINTEGTTTTVFINSQTFYGARHALETASQLIDYDSSRNCLQIVSSAEIHDFPAFSYRGILLDTSRNFFSVDDIKRTINSMSYNKLNTLHWHITDSHSFPLYLPSLPELSYYGTYSPEQLYTLEDVRNIIEYANVRGVKILPEFDGPSHAGNGWQFGSLQGLGNLVVCLNQEPWSEYCAEPPCGQLNIANPNLYRVLPKLYKEFISVFGSLDMFHFGGDEVNFSCWNSSKEVVDWMLKNNFSLSEDGYHDQWSVFQNKVYNLVTEANGGVKILGILWDSSLTKSSHIEKYLDQSKYVIQIWTKGKDPLIKDLLQKGYRIILSNHDAWYFDCGFGAWVDDKSSWCSPYKHWHVVYENSLPNLNISNNELNLDHLVLGGEAAMWSEQVDGKSVDFKLWPRGAALAERLWSNPSTSWHSAEYRMIHNRQRLVQRGIGADRLQPQWCHQNEGSCIGTRGN